MIQSLMKLMHFLELNEMKLFQGHISTDFAMLQCFKYFFSQVQQGSFSVANLARAHLHHETSLLGMLFTFQSL